MPDDVPYGFEKPVAKKLLDIAKAPGQSGTGFNYVPEQRRVAIAKTGLTGIAARSGSMPGSATITLCEIDGTNGIVTTTITETAYNITGSAVTGNAYIGIQREYVSGKWIVNLEDCGA